MAICTTVVFYGISECRFMTCFAGNGLVFIFKDETGLIMIEIFHAPDHVKGFFCMALTTILSELILMNICMAAVAICKRHTGKFLYLPAIFGFHFMAFYTINSLVFARQFIFCPVMIEF